MAVTDLRDQLQAALGDAYHLERELAPGGMSRLFLATERSLDRPVVIKVLPPEYASEVSAARFQREVTLTAHLQHPHILPIHAAGSKNGLLYYVMPYVEGESLRHRLEREGKLPVLAAVQILREIADALARAHKAGIVHRDIKPENILLQEDHALLADFGVARALQEATGAQRLTDTGTGLGTPGYMAPEQLAGERNVDARADVYALAVVGYEMLAGASPFAGGTPQAVAAAHFTAPPRPVAQLRPEVPIAVSDGIARALAKEPSDRFASAGAFRDALAASAGPHRSATGLSRTLALAGGALLLAGALVAGLAFARARARVPKKGPTLLAVLPFDNEGDSADRYFADGITDEIRAKLTATPGLQVIAASSSDRFRHSAKPVGQIAGELGVTYVVVGRVRWDKSGGTQPGQAHVLVQPELVEAEPDRPPTNRWAADFDAPLTGVFQVQSEIAQEVARALEVTLSTATPGAATAQATPNLDAYDAYLKAEEIARDRWNPAADRRAVPLYREAIRRDSTFAKAWARLASAYLFIYGAQHGAARGIADSARAAAERSLALSPDLPEGHSAMGSYYGSALHDGARAAAECSAGLARSPNNLALLDCAFGAALGQGRWQDVENIGRQAAVLDPWGESANNLGYIELLLHHYDAARSALDRAIARNPSDLVAVTNRVQLAIEEGDVASARAVLYAVPASVDTASLLCYIASIPRAGWLLDSVSRRKLLGLGTAAFGEDTAARALIFAWLYDLRGDVYRSRAYADTAARVLTTTLRVAPEEYYDHAERGMALALLGRSEEAIEEGELAARLMPPGRNGADDPPAIQQSRAFIYMRGDHREKAVAILDSLLRVPGLVSAGSLRVDPTWTPLRGDPAFERLIADTKHRPSS